MQWISLTNFGLMLYSGAAIAGGQAFLSVLSRNTAGSFNALSMLWASVLSVSFWGAAFLYVSGMLSMLILLRYLPLVHASVGIWAVTIICNVFFTIALGQSITVLQFTGIIFIFLGMTLLQGVYR
jgi:hypothetical protein